MTDLDRDLPTSSADVEQLRQARRRRPENPFAAVQSLVDSLPAAARKQKRSTAEGRPELEL